jgi:chemotaxis protein methyltransferase CheR
MDPSKELAEIEDILTALASKWGYDFRGYARSSLVRRFRLHLTQANYRSLEHLQEAVLSDEQAFARLLADLTVNVSEMFRDPAFFLSLRQDVAPILATWPSIRIWHAGCATGEEAYSLAILLKEVGLYEHCCIYATDISPRALAIARDGIYSLEHLRAWTESYQRAGGEGSLTSYFTARYDRAIISKELRSHMVFAEHNLVTDGSLGEMHLILCRNVLIYFGADLKLRVLRLMDESLCHGGYFALGTKESLLGTPLADRYQEIAHGLRLYRKAR